MLEEVVATEILENSITTLRRTHTGYASDAASFGRLTTWIIQYCEEAGPVAPTNSRLPTFVDSSNSKPPSCLCQVPLLLPFDEYHLLIICISLLDLLRNRRPGPLQASGG